MTSRRYDIIPIDGAWLLTDSASLLHTFTSSVDAIAFAKGAADIEERPVQVYLRRTGEPQLIYESAGRRVMRPD
jgi:hypothetical protein